MSDDEKLETILIGDAAARSIGAFSFVVGPQATSKDEAAVAVGIGAVAGKGACAVGHGVVAADGECKVEVEDWYEFFQELRESVTNPDAGTPEKAKAAWQKRKAELGL